MKKTTALLLTLVLMLFAGGSAQALSEPIAELPVYVTSAGQSADFEMMKVMMENAGVEFNSNMTAQPENIVNYKTLIVVIGGSSKGLGAAGIDANEELDRVASLIKAAEDNGMTIIAAHIGGSGRRGPLGNRFIAPVVEHADYVVVVAEGNQDGVFTDMAQKQGIPIDSIENMTDMIPLIPTFFK